MADHDTQADRYVRIIERAGGRYQRSRAQTGTIYVTVKGIEDRDDILVRFADHGECYCTEDISVDPMGCSLEQAVRSTMARTGLDLSRSLAAFRAATTARRRKAEAFAAKMAALNAAEKAKSVQAEGARRAWLAERYPDYASRSVKQQRRIRQKMNRALRAAAT